MLGLVAKSILYYDWLFLCTHAWSYNSWRHWDKRRRPYLRTFTHMHFKAMPSCWHLNTAASTHSTLGRFCSFSKGTHKHCCVRGYINLRDMLLTRYTRWLRDLYHDCPLSYRDVVLGPMSWTFVCILRYRGRYTHTFRSLWPQYHSSWNYPDLYSHVSACSFCSACLFLIKHKSSLLKTFLSIMYLHTLTNFCGYRVLCLARSVCAWFRWRYLWIANCSWGMTKYRIHGLAKKFKHKYASWSNHELLN